MTKLTLLYGHPADAAAFESYYAQSHLPLASKMKDVSRVELTKFSSAPDGGKAEYYRMAEIYFPSGELLQKTMESPEGKAAVADLDNFADGGVTVIVGATEG